MQLRSGMRVRVAPGSGVESGKTGVVVSTREVKTDGRGVAVEVQGAYYPLRRNEVYVRLNNGELIQMPKNRLQVAKGSQPRRSSSLGRKRASSGSAMALGRKKSLNTPVTRIIEYLRARGPMSGRDIVDDLGVEDVDVMLAEQQGFIKEIKPPHGGVSPWYVVAQTRKGGLGDYDYPHDMLRGYLTAALWCSTDESDESGGEPMDENYDIDDIDQESIVEAKKDINKFIDKAGDLLDDVDPEKAGHDFWLTRNGHGAGFWDGDYPEDIGEKLTDISHKFGEKWPYVGDDGKIYFG